jgi:hypothetical protein
MEELVAAEVSPERIVPVVNQAPRHPKVRAELTRVLCELGAAAMGGERSAPVVFAPTRKVDEAWRDGALLPAPLPALLAKAHAAHVDRIGPLVEQVPQLEMVAPGSLGAWSSDD